MINCVQALIKSKLNLEKKMGSGLTNHLISKEMEIDIFIWILRFNHGMRCCHRNSI